MLRISAETILVAGTPLQPYAFAGLVKRHPKGIETALALEAEAGRLISGSFSDQQLGEFIRHVCEWGGYPGTADRILMGNPLPEIRQRFSSAIAVLASDAPDVRFAVCEIRRVRHLGLSFASKHLRLMRPDVCPVLDSILSEKLGYPLKVRGYERFADDCAQVATLLQRCGVDNPVGRENGRWFAADVEMALFVHVKEQTV